MRAARIAIWIVAAVFVVGARQTITGLNPVTFLPEETGSYPNIVGATERQ